MKDERSNSNTLLIFSNNMCWNIAFKKIIRTQEKACPIDIEPTSRPHISGQNQSFWAQIQLGAVHKERPQILVGRGYPIADVCQLEGGEGSEECRYLHFFKDNQDKSLSKTQKILSFELLRKKIIHIKWLHFPC